MTDSTTDAAADTTEGGVTEAEGEGNTLLTAGDEQINDGTADQTAEDGDEGGEGETKVEEAKGAPEQYADFTFPEGVEIDAEALGEFKDVAKELNLDQASAQKVAEIGAKLAEKWATAAQTQHQAILDGWITEVKADKEIGGDALPQNLAVAKRALDTYGNQGLKDLLNTSGFGNNPDVIKFMRNVGLTLKEDTVVTGREKAASKTAGDLLYDNPTSRN